MSAQPIALLSESARIDPRALSVLAGAINRELSGDFFKAWNQAAFITPYGKAADVPPDAWRVIVVPHQVVANGKEVSGAHYDSVAKQPFALVSDSGPNWGATVSHEVMEMIVDPELASYRPGVLQGKKVSFLVEICDPCQALPYDIDGVGLSEYVTPAYFNGAADGALYSNRGTIRQPLTVANRGYLVWRSEEDADVGEHYAFTSVDRVGRVLPLGKFPGGLEFPRSWADSVVRKPRLILEKALSQELTKRRRQHVRKCDVYACAWHQRNRRLD